MTTPTHSAQQPQTERWLDTIGATWRFDPDLPLHRIDQGASLANQVRHEALNREVVDRYTADMARGDQFPPLLVASHGDDYAILGGNHRHAAHANVHHATAPAYIVEATPAVLLRIRVEDNRRHGLPTTAAERTEHGIALIAAGVSQGDAAAIVGVPQPKLSVAIGVADADARAKRLDLPSDWLRMPAANRYQLGQLDHDDVFAAAATLTIRAAVPAADVKRIVRACLAVEPVEALRIIGAEEADWDDRAAQRSGNARAVRTARGRLDSALAEIRGINPRDVAATCPNADVAAVLAQRILDTAAILAACHEALTALTGRRAA